ncbi:MAG: uroporphyrinogen decarboxylase family protein, partial [Phycisphaerae bacterium]
MATLRGEPVDRPAVNFYEIGGFDVDPGDPDEFNVYTDPSWRPLLQLAEEHTDIIRMRHPALTPAADNPRDELFHTEAYMQGRSRFQRTTLSVAGREMPSLSRRDPDRHTTGHLEHLLKDARDLEAYLELPEEVFAYDVDVAGLEAADEEAGDRGIVMVDTGDPICHAAPLFSMEDFTVVALTEQRLFHRLLEKLAPPIWKRTEKVSAAFPGHLWRICGPEYATEPYLPPRLFQEYVARYTAPMIESIRRHGGFARLHCHGRIRSALPHIVEMGADATDPIEPPPLGDVELADVRREYGRQLVLFGNIEIRDVENLPPAEFEKLVAKSLADGTAGEGRGFVLMPTACPCGRTITPRTMANYETMVRLATGLA